MIRYALISVAGLGLAACAAPVPDSGAGVGFSEYSQFEIERARTEAAFGTAPPNISGAPTQPILPPTPVSSGGISSNDLAAAGIGSGGGLPIAAPGAFGTAAAPPPVLPGGADPLRTAGVQASPANATLPPIASTGISNEQDFDAVSGERGIEDDAALRQQQQAAYQVIQPTALPTRDGNVGPNIVEYALNAPNRVGQEWYSRSLLVISPQRKFERNCASYRSPDEAQRDFLARGGPERDPQGIDPDGDGFACGWDPAPYLLVTGRG